MNILHITRQFYPCIGGVENFVLNLAREQKALGHNVSILTLDKNFADGNALDKSSVFQGIKVDRIPFFGSRRYPIALSSIEYIKNIDILHIHCIDFFIDYLALLKILHRKKMFLHTHGGFFHTKWMRLAKIVYFNTITRLVLKSCEKIIACSESDYAIFRKISDRVVRIDNGVDIARFSLIDKRIEPGTLLYIGRIDSNKRIDNLINTVAEVRKKIPDVRLKILGPDYSNLIPGLKRLASDLGLNNVTFLGVQGDEVLENELSRAHLFVSASEYEAFGISTVEAMASGTLCVLNDIEAFRDITLSGQTGFLTDFADHESSAARIIAALYLNKEEYNNYVSRAKSTAAKYDWHKVAKEITDLYI